jgi:hypothetical protein
MKSDSTKPPTSAQRAGLPVPLGLLVATPGALAALSRDEVLTAVGRHARGDWGDCGADDAAENDFSLDKHLRLLSVYHSTAGVKFWVITEADRSVTTVLLPEDY